MAHCRLNKTTGNGAPPILIVWADEGEPGFDCLFLSPSKARAIIELMDEIREFANDGTGHHIARSELHDKFTTSTVKRCGFTVGAVN